MLTSRTCQVIRSLIEPTVNSTVTVICKRSASRSGLSRAASTSTAVNDQAIKSTTSRLLLATPTTTSLANHRRYISNEGGANNQISQTAVVGKPAYQGPGRLMFQREMKRQDSQMHGTVHGGVIMQMLEEGGALFSTQYCQAFERESPNSITTMTATLEKAEFLMPMFIGEIAEVYAELGYTSAHSMQVIVRVMAYNEDSDERRLINRAKLWYVPRRRGQDKLTILPVPQMKYESSEQQEKGRLSYERMRAARKTLKEDGTQRVELSPSLAHFDCGDEDFTVPQSRTQIIKPVRPSYCWPGENYCRGGIPLKMIDDIGCISAVQFCKSFCVTVSNDNTVFFKPMDLGSLLVANSRIIFTSSRSLELKVDVDEVKIVPGQGIIRERAIESILTCLALDESFQPKAMPQLKIRTEEEQKIFDERKRLYEERKKEKAAAKNA